jgi:hypothetical protein
LVAVLVLCAFANAAAPSVDFQRGSTAYERGEWARTIQLLRPLLYPELRLETEAEVVQAHRMLGVAFLFEKQPELAKQEFRKLLQLRPDYRFDTLLDPPQVVDFFNGILRENETELAQIEARRREEARQKKIEADALARAKAGPTVVEKRLVRNSFAVNFIPFGAGQFQNGQRGKGWGFLIAEAGLAATSVGALTANFALYGANYRLPCVPSTDAGGGCVTDQSAKQRSQTLTRVQVISGGLFFAVAAWGIADAILNFRPEVPVARIQPTPILIDRGLGAGLAFRF